MKFISANPKYSVSIALQPVNTHEEQLMCPGCGQGTLHHSKVEVFERVEDANQGVHATVGGMKVYVDTRLTGNPSLRRDGIVVHLYCECGRYYDLNIAQHKGSTFLSMWYVGIDTD